jgi:ABC-type lipoprotein release transport system permease subunit
MIFKIASRNLWRSKRRSLITITSIAFAVLLASLMRSVQLGSYDRMIENSARFYTGYIQVHQKGYWDDKMLDNSFEEDKELNATINNTEGVEIAVPRIESFALSAYGTKTKGTLILGVDPTLEDSLTHVKSKIIKGEYLASDDKAILIAEGLAKYLNIDIGDTLILLGQGYHGTNAAGIYPVKGIMKFPVPIQNNQTVYMPLDEAQWFFDMENRLTSLSLVVDKAKNVDRVVASISSQIDLNKLEGLGGDELMPEMVQGIEIDNISGKVMLWILYTVIGFGMFGTFLMMTVERMYEFGVMISIGMKRIQLQLIIAVEMAIMATVGVLLGVLISLPIIAYYHYNPIILTGDSAKAIEKFGIEAGYFFSFEPSLFYNQAWVIFFMVLILGFYPIYFVQRLQPVKAMRDGK